MQTGDTSGGNPNVNKAATCRQLSFTDRRGIARRWWNRDRLIFKGHYCLQFNAASFDHIYTVLFSLKSRCLPAVHGANKIAAALNK